MILNQDVDRNIYNKVIFECWPKDCFNSICDLKKIITFYNDCYENFDKRLDEELEKCHPAAWILEAYKQLELWTVIYYDDPQDQVTGFKEFAPAGRYGWRYIIDKSLERLTFSYSFKALRPDNDSINTVFTLLLGMGQTSELSNYIHFLKNKLTSPELKFSPDLILNNQIFSGADETLFNAIRASLSSSINWDEYEQFSPNNAILTEKVDLFLQENFSISIKEIHQIFDSISEGITSINASIVVQPYEDFISLTHELSGISKLKIKSLMEICFHDMERAEYKQRDFLRKNQQSRMLFYAGVIVNLDSDFEVIYDLKSAIRKVVINSNKHIIISPRLFAEWVDIFILKLVLGQRDDLKNYPNLKQKIIDIESYYKIKIFEGEVMNLLKKREFYCFNLKKIKGEEIGCGEIDIIAYSYKKNILYVIECKAYAPIVDARGLGQVLSDHYNQKKYHQKFMKKIEWVNKNKEIIIPIYQTNFNITPTKGFTITPFFITLSSSFLGLIEDKYNIMTFYEFDKFLEDDLRRF